jgi:cell fate (sporulation/competence/biofilm development) regulator YlbF (YheA/YmcA/DUF963 family)
MDIYNKARELAKMIENSDELNNLKDFQAQVFHNDYSKNLTVEYNEIYEKFAKAVNEQNESEISKLKLSYNEVMEKINKDKLTKDMFDAKDRFDKMIETVNNIVNFAITGDEEKISNCDCSSSGCSCSGCR